MDSGQVRSVKADWAALEPRRDRLALAFFERLFADEPSLRLAFAGDLGRHGRELQSGLAAIVASLDRPRSIEPALEWLAVRASRRGLGPRHHAAVARALLAALAAEGGVEGERLEAWRAGCRLVAGIMADALAAEPLAA